MYDKPRKATRQSKFPQSQTSPTGRENRGTGNSDQHKKNKRKASRTRYQALGPELILGINSQPAGDNKSSTQQ